ALERDMNGFVQYECNTSTITAGLLLHFNAPACPSPTPVQATATRTRTSTPPPLPSVTPPLPTITPGGPPTATSTPCTIIYTDVPPSDPFYTYIRCLACRGIVNGYTTSPPCVVAPCYLPGNPVTRG